MKEAHGLWMKSQHFLAFSWEKKRPTSNLDGLVKVRGFTGGYQILVESIKFDNLCELE